MKCPHCLENFHDHKNYTQVGRDTAGYWSVSAPKCPACKRLVLHLARSTSWSSGPIDLKELFLIYPRGSTRQACPPQVPKHIAEDFTEACLVLPDSAKASAALSRRCLQNLLREAANVKQGNLADEIQQTIDSGKLPSQLADSIDAIRNIGNFSAHPIKSKNSGEIMPVDPQEAEWNLDVLESLFDFYFVQPALLKAKRDALNQKLADAGKPEMK